MTAYIERRCRERRYPASALSEGPPARPLLQERGARGRATTDGRFRGAVILATLSPQSIEVGPHGAGALQHKT